MNELWHSLNELEEAVDYIYHAKKIAKILPEDVDLLKSVIDSVHEQVNQALDKVWESYTNLSNEQREIRFDTTLDEIFPKRIND